MKSILCAVVALGFSSSVVADTIVVPPEDADLIQYLINVAVNHGDVIQLEAGTYMVPGTINTNGLAITIRGAVDGDGYPTSILDGAGKHMVLQCNSGEDTSTEFRDLVIANGYFSGGGGGMLCSVSSPSLVNCVFTGNASAYHGGGIYCNSGSPTLTDCVLMNNAASNWGGGIYCASHSYPSLNNCVISGNSAGDGGGISNWNNSQPTLVGCVVRDNVAEGGSGGGGIYNASINPILVDTMVCQNSPSQIYGGYNDNGGNIVQDICTCFADISNTGEVGGADLGILLLLWETDNAVADLNDDGIVNGGDLGLVLLNWGPCP